MSEETGNTEKSGAPAHEETRVGMVLYLGEGVNYVEGVPARDLTRDEWNGVREDLRTLALATGLYLDPLAGSEPIKPEVVTIDMRDGVSDAEANGAGRALNARKSKSNPK